MRRLVKFALPLVLMASPALAQTRDATEVVPVQHFYDGALLNGLPEVCQVLLAAPYSRWTQAAWLATPSPALTNQSPIDFLRSGGDVDLVLAAARAYAERAV